MTKSFVDVENFTRSTAAYTGNKIIVKPKPGTENMNIYDTNSSRLTLSNELTGAFRIADQLLLTCRPSRRLIFTCCSH